MMIEVKSWEVTDEFWKRVEPLVPVRARTTEPRRSRIHLANLPLHMLLTPHDVYLGLVRSEADRLEAYRALFRPELDADAIGDVRTALEQPLASAQGLDADELNVTAQYSGSAS